MAKRRRVEEEGSAGTPKKRRLRYDYDLSLLSDELVLKVFTYLPISDLAICQRLSRRLQRLAGDSEIWKEKYYARWVKPRALRIPGLRGAANPLDTFRYSSRLAKWLEDGHLVQQGRNTDWRRQYRLRDNWWRGHCRILEVDVADPPAPPVLVKIHRGITFTADPKNGLRAWTMKTNPSLIASLSFAQRAGDRDSIEGCPTSLGVDTGVSNMINVCIGFKDGSFALYGLHRAQLSLRYAHPRSSNGALVAITAYHPYTLAMSDNGVLSMYRFQTELRKGEPLPDLRLLVSLRSSNVLLPVSVSIRPISGNLVATIAYSFCRLGCGWSLGLQELRMSESGEALDSRLTSSIEEDISTFQTIENRGAHAISARSATSQPFVLHPQSMARPTALSYSHPYLLASLPDNTLMTHLVTSNADQLEIAPGRRLWGHTSSVAGVQVGDRGKAVSVSTRGGEIRVWELEDVLSSTSYQRRTSVCIRPKMKISETANETQDLAILTDAIRRRGDGLGLARHEILQAERRRKWVGFDDEQVVVLDDDHLSQRQILSCYDFT